jgi:hypothetical protein
MFEGKKDMSTEGGSEMLDYTVNERKLQYSLKNAVFWDVARCGFIINGHLTSTYRLMLFLTRVISSALKMEAFLKRRFIINLHGTTSQKTDSKL